MERCPFAQATIESKIIKKFIIEVSVLILHCTESSATYYRSLMQKQEEPCLKQRNIKQPVEGKQGKEM